MKKYIYYLESVFTGSIEQEHSFNNNNEMREHLSFLIRSSNHLSIDKVIYKSTGKIVPDYNASLKQYYGC